MTLQTCGILASVGDCKNGIGMTVTFRLDESKLCTIDGHVIFCTNHTSLAGESTPGRTQSLSSASLSKLHWVRYPAVAARSSSSKTFSRPIVVLVVSARVSDDEDQPVRLHTPEAAVA